MNDAFSFVENVYNGDGLRVEKIVDGVRTRFFYEYSRVLLEQTGGYIIGRNVYGTNLLMRAVGVDTFYYMYNAHADVTALVTPDGRIAATYDYDPFGNVIEKTGDADNNILFAGYQYDPETGMYYLNSRMYDPITARFLQEDTYTGVGSAPLSLNLYTYCYNSPLKYYDLTGHSPESIQRIQDKIDELSQSGSHNAGLWSQIKGLEEQKERETRGDQKAKANREKKEDERTKSVESTMKDYPEFSGQKNIQALDACKNYMGYSNYVSAVERNVTEYKKYKPGEDFATWQGKQLRPDTTASSHLPWMVQETIQRKSEQTKIDRLVYANQRLETMLPEMLESPNPENFKDKMDLIAEVFGYTEMTSQQEDFFWDAIAWLGTPYDHCDFAYNQGIADCSAFARSLYLENGIGISLDTSQSRSSCQMWMATDQNSKDHYIDLLNSEKNENTSITVIKLSRVVFTINFYQKNTQQIQEFLFIRMRECLK